MSYYNYSTDVQSVNVSKVMRRVFSKMFMAMVITTLSAYMVLSVPALASFIFTNTWVYWGCRSYSVVLSIFDT